MTDKTDPIAHAARLLREAAQELQQNHTLRTTPNDWTGEPEAKAAYDEHMGAAAALECWAEAIGAGGVSGPLMGRPQEMPDLSQLTERGAVAWAGVDAQALREGCASPSANAGEPSGHIKEPYTLAEIKAKIASNDYSAEMLLQHAMLLLDSASLAASVGEPVAWMTFTEEGDPDMVFLDRLEACQYCEDDDPPKPLYLAAPTTAQAEGWTKASKQLPPCRGDQLYIGINTAGFAGVFNAVRVVNGNTYCLMEVAEESVSIMSDLAIWKPFNPPTSAEGVEHG